MNEMSMRSCPTSSSTDGYRCWLRMYSVNSNRTGAP